MCRYLLTTLSNALNIIKRNANYTKLCLTTDCLKKTCISYLLFTTTFQ